MPTNRRFLLVEDNDAHAKLFLFALREWGAKIHVDRVIDGEKAIAYLHRAENGNGAERPDLVILDLNLPRVSGHEVLQVMKANQALCAIPVVVLTTSSSDDDRCRAYHLHANSYLVKPLELKSFAELVRLIVEYWGRLNEEAPALRVPCPKASSGCVCSAQEPI